MGQEGRRNSGAFKGLSFGILTYPNPRKGPLHNSLEPPMAGSFRLKHTSQNKNCINPKMKCFLLSKNSSAVKRNRTSFFLVVVLHQQQRQPPPPTTHHPPTIIRRLKDLGPHPEGPSSQEPEGMGVAWRPLGRIDVPQIFPLKKKHKIRNFRNRNGC